MRRRSFLGSMVVALTAVTAAVALAVPFTGGEAAFAQGGGGRGGGRMMGGVALLAIPQVQTELKMTPDQIAKAGAKQQEVRDALRGLAPTGGEQPTPEAMLALAVKRQEVQSKAVAGILDATQQKRFRQIELQQQGPLSLATRKDAADELKLTDDQKKSIAVIQKQNDDDLRAARQGANFQSMSPEERTAWMTKNQQIQKANGDKIAALLTDAQKAQWKTMLGDPFKLPAMNGPRGAEAPAPAPPPAAPTAPAL